MGWWIGGLVVAGVVIWLASAWRGTPLDELDPTLWEYLPGYPDQEGRRFSAREIARARARVEAKLVGTLDG